jgi:hypothetical protein
VNSLVKFRGSRLPHGMPLRDAERSNLSESDLKTIKGMVPRGTMPCELLPTQLDRVNPKAKPEEKGRGEWKAVRPS